MDWKRKVNLILKLGDEETIQDETKRKISGSNF
jgi:hypothetical protein